MADSITIPSAQGNRISTGAAYLFRGVKLLMHKQLRAYLIVPILVNLVLFFVLTRFFWGYFDSVLSQSTSWMPGWLESILSPIAWLLKPIVWIVVGGLFLLVYGYSFNMITNILAAPFYGILSERVEWVVRGSKLEPEPLWKLVPRVFRRELAKLVYFLLRGLFIMLLVLLVGFIPIINIAAPFIGLAWAAWSMSVQYADYPADNHQFSFTTLRKKLRTNLKSSLGFGAAVTGCTLIPLVNILIMPAAVVGGTLYWIEELEQTQAQN